ncbi:hypothetical protein GCM10023185_33330 [Hymenobacter saemangeumensis]|uniref:ATP-binding protein n=1 Tax=Hymenobacter saemangeumensis TaxID=1084522 RepID=A0ABP8IN83_9BACT
MGGRRTFIGTTFQAEVGAYVAGLLLTERPLSRLGAGLPGYPQKIQFETPTAVDDLLVATEVGEVYVQAKRTISLAPKAEDALASVAGQFVRQYLDGVWENGVRRDLIPARDRLVLAVSTSTAASVTMDLREALDRNRTNAATAVPKRMQDALNVLARLLDAAWLDVAGSAITPAKRQELLALCSVIVVGDKDRQLVEEALTDVAPAGAETALADLLEVWAANGCATGVGGDAAAIRLALSDKIKLKEPPSFQQDVRRLYAYSAATLTQLARFTTIEVPEGTINVARPVAARVVAAAQLSDLAITGEPGAGKSAIMYAAAQALGQQSPVFCFTVEGGAGTLAALQQEIGLEHPLLDVLRQVPGPRPAYLLLDALDASRGGVAEGTYKKLLDAVAAWPDWRVVASVRSFDLRMGRDWQRVFRGPAPFPEHTDASFPAVRHLHLGLLGPEERADLARQSPTLDDALTAGGSKLEALAQNPFNLALLADLLTGGTAPTALAGVSTRGQLLAQYWRERITGLGQPATSGLAYLVRQLLKAKAITISQALIKPTVAKAIDNLERVGVLALEPSRQVVGFRHHVLFDYAVARLALLPEPAAAREQLRKEKAAGLLLAPSLGYWVEGLKDQLSPSEFWRIIAPLVADTAIDPIVRLEVARLVVDAVRPTDDLTVLGSFFSGGEALATQSFRQFVGALRDKSQTGGAVEVGPWARLLAGMAAPGADQLGIMQVLIGELLDSRPDADALACLGAAARRLLASIADDERLTNWLSKFVIPYVIRTYGTDPAASREQLARIFEPARFAQFGYLEVPVLAQHVLAIAAHDANLVVELHYRAFGPHDFRHDQATTMVQSTILSMSSNAGQEFEMAAYNLEQDFPALLASFPQIGIRALAATLRGVREKNESSFEALPLSTVVVGGVAYPFANDDSVAWASALDRSQSASYAKIYQAFCSWLPSVQDPALLAALPGLLLAETGTALVWRVLFEAGAMHPAHLGSVLTRPAASAPVLQSHSTRQSAIVLLAMVYSQLPAADREALEQDWLALEFAAYPNPPAARLFALGKLFTALGEAQLATPAARDFLKAAQATGHALENKPLFTSRPVEIHRVREGDTEWPWAEKGPLPGSEPDPIPALVRAVTDAQAAVQAQVIGAAPHLQEALLALDDACREDDGPLDDGIVHTLVWGLSSLLAHTPAAAATYPAAVARLLALTHHPSPAAEATAEANFARFAITGFPLARVEAARALASLVALPELWPLLEERFEALLLHDPYPAVRAQLAGALRSLSHVAEETAWQLTEKFAARENNPTVISEGVRALERLLNHDAVRIEPFFLELATRTAAAGHIPSVLTKSIVFMALKRELAASQTLLQSWVAGYATEEKQLMAVLSELRGYFVLGYGTATPAQVASGTRARALVWSLIEAIEPAVRAWPTDGQEPTDEQIIALKLFSEIAGQFTFAVGRHELPASLVTSEAQRRFLIDYAPLISRLTMLGPPGSIHYLLDVLGQLVAANPPLCFDLFSEAILRTTGVARYEHESLGASRFVELVTQYLADYRFIFADEVRRTKLIECLAVFVDAGWPEARRLFQQLPELLQ